MMNTSNSEISENNQDNEKEPSTSGQGDVRRGTGDKMPKVRRVGKPRRKRNNRDALPGMRDNHPPGSFEDVQDSKDKMVVRSVSDLNPVEKIELLNAYKALYEDLPSSAQTRDGWIYNILRTGYQNWVNDRIKELFGEGKATSVSPTHSAQFTETETVALKALAQAIQQKKQTPQAPPKATPPAPREPGTPLNTNEYIKSQEGFLQQLAKLDREGPQF